MAARETALRGGAWVIALLTLLGAGWLVKRAVGSGRQAARPQTTDAQLERLDPMARCREAAATDGGSPTLEEALDVCLRAQALSPQGPADGLVVELRQRIACGALAVSAEAAHDSADAQRLGEALAALKASCPQSDRIDALFALAAPLSRRAAAAECEGEVEDKDWVRIEAACLNYAQRAYCPRAREALTPPPGKKVVVSGKLGKKGWRPRDPLLVRYLAATQALGVPVAVHCGAATETRTDAEVARLRRLEFLTCQREVEAARKSSAWLTAFNTCNVAVSRSRTAGEEFALGTLRGEAKAQLECRQVTQKAIDYHLGMLTEESEQKLLNSPAECGAHAAALKVVAEQAPHVTTAARLGCLEQAGGGDWPRAFERCEAYVKRAYCPGYEAAVRPPTGFVLALYGDDSANAWRPDDDALVAFLRSQQMVTLERTSAEVKSGRAMPRTILQPKWSCPKGLAGKKR